MVELSKGPVGKNRSPLLVIIFSIFTLGLYWFYWFYKTNSELSEHDPELGISPFTRILCIFPGCFLLGLPTLYAYYATVRDISKHVEKEGQNGVSAVLYTILIFIPFGSFYAIYRIQSLLNNNWELHEKTPAQTAVPSQPVASTTSPEQTQTVEEDTEEIPFKKGKTKKCPRCKTVNNKDSNYCRRCGEEM